MSDGECRICGKTLRGNHRSGNKSHAGKHCREFEEETGYSKHTDYELIVAYYKPENARDWAVRIMKALKETGKIPEGASLKDW